MKVYTPTIGIECHVQLKTSTKLFSAVGNDAREAKPNSLISHICVGMPGALPYLNEAAVELAARAAIALGTKPQKFSKFDRKHYFYPDLPKGYQISQYDQPIIIGGQVEIEVDGQTKVIGITRAHLEEDAGKNTHPEGANYSLVDLNRAGTPLLEIVSEPDIHSPTEAKAFARELYLLMKFAGVSDCDLYHGNMRFDVNISLSADKAKLGKRAEVKNLNSFKSVESAVAYEIKRQSELLDSGHEVVQETRGWDEAKQKTTPQRGKEEAHDYRYMPEPDIPPITLDDEFIERIKQTEAVLPGQWREKLNSLELDKALTETAIEAEVEFDDFHFLALADQDLKEANKAKFLLNWYINISLPLLREGKLKLNDSQTLEAQKLIYSLTQAGKISSSSAKELFIRLASMSDLPKNIEEYAESQGLLQLSDEGDIDKLVAEVLASNQKAAEDVKNGEMKAIGFLVGQVMAKSKGQANPGLAQQLIKRQLGIK